MLLRLIRHESAPEGTLGELFINDSSERLCWTYEDKVREIEGVPVAAWKVQDQTAIPRGEYRVIIDYSNRFERMMPHVMDVPGFAGIRIHSGNTSKDTDGCILVGFAQAEHGVYESRAAFSAVYRIIEEELLNGQAVKLSVG